MDNLAKLDERIYKRRQLVLKAERLRDSELADRHRKEVDILLDERLVLGSYAVPDAHHAADPTLDLE